MTRPYLTMVTNTRNDDYGGGILDRLQFTVDILREQMERHEIESELILVEWNPPPERPRLAEALRLPKSSSHLSVRILEVAPEIHRRYRHAELHPLHGAVAFNAALRRARGEFTVLRVSDAIWSEQLVGLIAERRLEHHTKYRCTRADISPGILDHPEASLADKLSYCASHVTMVMEKMPYYVRGLPPLELNSDGDFQLLATDTYRELRGYQETENVDSARVDGLLEHCAYAAGIEDVLWRDTLIYKIDHASSYKNRILATAIPLYARIGRWIPAFVATPAFIRLVRRTGLTRLLYDRRRLQARGMQVPRREEYFQHCRRIVAGEEPFVLNGDDWGLANEALPERWVLRADWERDQPAAPP